MEQEMLDAIFKKIQELSEARQQLALANEENARLKSVISRYQELVTQLAGPVTIDGLIDITDVDKLSESEPFDVTRLRLKNH